MSLLNIIYEEKMDMMSMYVNMVMYFVCFKMRLMSKSISACLLTRNENASAYGAADNRYPNQTHPLCFTLYLITSI